MPGDNSNDTKWRTKHTRGQVALGEGTSSENPSAKYDTAHDEPVFAEP